MKMSFYFNWEFIFRPNGIRLKAGTRTYILRWKDGNKWTLKFEIW